MHGTPKLAAGFDHLPYVNPDAPKGGRIRLGNLGSFDSVNPLIIKGEQAAGVREFSIETLMARDLDEPFTLHGLLAESIDIADDRKSVVFAMNPKARFSDRSPVTVDDVLFSFEMLKTKGRLNHRTYFAKVVSAERLSDTQVRFTFADASDRELPLILGLMPVFSKAATNPDTFEQTTMTPLVGSGPYTITKIDPGRSLTYTRDSDYWAKDEPVSRGRFNFDEIQFDYYRESTAMFEAFKSGLIDLRLEEDPSNWAGSYEFAAVRDGRIIKAAFDIGLPAGMTALAFNTRRDVFKNPKVRQALIMLFDFEWINRTLYNGLYKRTESYFERSYLSSAGKPADATERSLLAPYEARVKPEIMAGTYKFAESDGSGQNRANQRLAFDLLKEAGYELQGGKLVDKATGKPLRFEILAHNQVQETLLSAYARSLAPLGINARVRVIDSAQYQRRLNAYDYDMIQTTWASSLSPGNEQLFRWSSANAIAPATWNYAGVQNDAVDAMIAALLAAESEDTFVSSVRSLDRVLLSGDYVVPMFYVPNQWVAHWARLKHPDKTPLFGYALDTWWIEEKK
ncbi:MAG: extracellular solute-binding protein [Hyphomicrobiaceae bacterium]